VLRALSICAPAALFDAPSALAQAFEPTALAADIPAQPLAQALEEFARQTGLQFVYVSGIVSDQRSHAVSARLTANEALARMLQGTGLKFEYLTTRSIRVLIAAVGPQRQSPPKTPSGNELQEVVVTANRREENLQNVPITIQVLTGETLTHLNVTTFDDFAKYLPGVTAHGVVRVKTASTFGVSEPANTPIRLRDRTVVSPMSPSTSMSNPRSFRTAIWTSTLRISSASRYWKARKAPCSEREPRRGCCATLRISRSSTASKRA